MTIDVDRVRRAYYDTLSKDQSRWWIARIFADPNELIVDDDQGTLYLVRFTISETGIIFAEPVEARVDYVPLVPAQPATTKGMP